jgi:hypothetical protein
MINRIDIIKSKKKSSKREVTMKKFITFILAAISIVSISILFTGCGKQTAEDIAGEYVKIKDGQEIKQDNKHYYLIVLQKETTYQNKPAIEMRYTIQRYNPDLDKYYYVNNDFYIDAKTLESFDLETHTLKVKDSNNIILNSVQYKKVSSKTVTIDDTKYTSKKLIEELVKIPKFYEMDDTHISDPFSGFTTELRQYVNY